MLCTGNFDIVDATAAFDFVLNRRFDPPLMFLKYLVEGPVAQKAAARVAPACLAQTLVRRSGLLCMRRLRPLMDDNILALCDANSSHCVVWMLEDMFRGLADLA